MYKQAATAEKKNIPIWYESEEKKKKKSATPFITGLLYIGTQSQKKIFFWRPDIENYPMILQATNFVLRYTQNKHKHHHFPFSFYHYYYYLSFYYYFDDI